MIRIYCLLGFCIVLFFTEITRSYSQKIASDSTIQHAFESNLQELLDEEVDYENLWSNARVMTASRSSERIETAPATIYVITDQQIRQRGYTSLEEYFGRYSRN